MSVESDLLEVVEESPRAAGAHDRAGWVGLFTADGRVEDPVGSQPHVGALQIGRFYDTFIAPRKITFHRDVDIVRPPVVIRDLEIEADMGGGVVMRIPAFLRYDLRRDEDHPDDGHPTGWRLARLRAYWNLPAMMRQFVGNGPRALPAALRLSGALLRNQRIAGTGGFLAGFRRPGALGHDLAQRLNAALTASHPAVITDQLGGLLAGRAALTWGDDTVAEAGELTDRLRGAVVTKQIGAGQTVVSALRGDGLRGVLFADVDRRARSVTAARFFPAS